MNIQETTFGPKKYLTLKKSISTSEITDKLMYDQAGKKLNEYIQENKLTITGPWSVLYFTWDEANKKTDIGISFEVAGLQNVTDSELSLVEIAQTKASLGVLRGSYNGLGETHHALMDYVSKNKLNTGSVPVMAVEEYVVDPMTESNQENFLTNVYYLHN